MKAIMRQRCPACGRVFSSDQFDPKKRYRCPRCRQAALEPLPGPPTPAGSGSRPNPGAETPSAPSAPPEIPKSKSEIADPIITRDPSREENATITLDRAPPAIASPPRLTLQKPGRPPAAEEAGDPPALRVPPSAPPPSAPPPSLGRHRILRELGRGGMGVVYLAEDPELKRKVALKVLLAGEGASEDSVRRFLREARAAAKLRHPNIVGLHEFGEDGGRPWFTMDYVEGVTLAERLKAGRIPPREAVELLQTVALTLAFAHGQGIVHRDLKPSNILLAREGKPFLMDFGLAKDVSGDASLLSHTGQIFGTPAYMSPEQAQGRVGEIDARSDVFSLGVILYEALGGSNPFQGNTIYNTISRVIERDPPPLRVIRPNLEPDLDVIVENCLRKDPAKRYPTMEALAGDLLRYLAGEPLAASREGAISKARRAARKNRPAVAVGAAALLLLVLTALVVSALARKSEVERLAANLSSPSADERRLAMEGLRLKAGAGTIPERERGIAREAARRALKDADPRVRAIAAAAAGETEDRGSAHGLAAMAAGDASDEARLAALRALTALRVPEAADRVGAILHDPKAPMALRIEAARALSAAGGMGAVHHLLREAAAPDAMLRTEVQKAIDNLRPPSAILSAYLGGGAGTLNQALGDLARAEAKHQEDLEFWLAKASGAPGERRPSEPFEKAAAHLSSPDAATRRLAAYDIGRLGKAEAVPLILKALGGEADPEIAALLIESLKQLAPQGDSRLLPLLSSEVPVARRNAALASSALGYRDAADGLRLLVGREKNREALEVGLRALGKLGGPQDADLLGGLIGGADPSVQVAAMEALESLGEKKACPWIVPYLGNRDESVRAAARRALVTITGSDRGPDPAAWRGN